MSDSAASARSAVPSGRLSGCRRPPTEGRPQTCEPSPRALRRPGRDRAVLEKRGGRPATSIAAMIKQITHSQVYVLDQDEALEFYVGKLGLEVNTDADLGFM